MPEFTLLARSLGFTAAEEVLIETTAVRELNAQWWSGFYVSPDRQAVPVEPSRRELNYWRGGQNPQKDLFHRPPRRSFDPDWTPQPQPETTDEKTAQRELPCQCMACRHRRDPDWLGDQVDDDPNEWDG